MINRAALIIFLTVFSVKIASGQSCVIVSDDYVCIDDPIYFSVQTSGGTAQTYTWNLQENQNSTQAAPFAKYKISGSKVINVTVTLAGGGTCQASKTIEVHPLPVANFSINGSNNYCLSKNSVCIKDLSVPGPTGSAIVQRVVLWGDGDASLSNNPVFNQDICHKYSNEGTFTIIIEVTDIKGCIHRYSNTVKVVKDVKALFGYNITGNCDTANLCLDNLTQSDSVKLKSYYWLMGDGTVDSVSWSQVCKTYRDSGSYSPSLVVITKEGCMDTFRQNNLVVLNPIKFNIVKNKYSGCSGDVFNFMDNGPAKNFYFWYYRDSSNQASVPAGEGNPFTIIGDNPGKIYITLTAIRGTCRSSSLADSIEVFGPKAKADVRNNSICIAGSDTTYFCDNSNYKNTKGVKRLWDTYDPHCPPCTTDIINGLNLGMNCRYTNEHNPKHVYKVNGCYVTTLALIDTITGCGDTTEVSIQIGKSDTTTYKLNYTNVEPCIGSDESRRFYYILSGFCGRYYINPDSALGINRFVAGLNYHTYPSLSHPSGYVTVGLILESGTPKMDCNGNTLGSVCRDTFWYHDYYKVNLDINTKFDIKKASSCNPFSIDLVLKDSTNPDVTSVSIDWGDGNTYLKIMNAGDTMQGNHKHTYAVQGQYFIKVTMSNKWGCINSTESSISAGHVSSFQHKTDPCKGDCIWFKDEVLYYGDTTEYWKDPVRISNGKESIFWDFGHGNISQVSQPTFCFRDTGLQTVRLITTDSMGCIDTVTSSFLISGPEAVIKFDKERILCTEIVQFFDSSYVPNVNINEFVVSWRWDFGDGKTPSYLKDPFHFYSSFGPFKVRLIVTTNRGCKDTTYKDIYVEGPQPSFEFITDSIGCAPLTVSMKNTSESVISWIWFFGDPGGNIFSTIYDSSVTFTYTTPGTYHLYLYGADSINNPVTGNRQYCTATFPDTSTPQQIRKTVVVKPIPPVDFVTNDTICVNEATFFRDDSDSKYTRYRWYIDNNDSLITDNKSYPYTFTKAGTYVVKYFPTYDPDPGRAGCYDSAIKTVEVIDVTALFDIDQNLSNSMHKYFVNQSTGAVRYEWNFGQPASGTNNTSTQVSPNHIYYPEIGTFTVCLKAFNSRNCEDVYCLEVTTEIKNYLFIPNSFTPGTLNNMNDAFDILIDGEEKYDLKIYNRWGELVFEGNKDGIDRDGINWDGKDKNTGNDCTAGVYFVVFDYNFYFEEPVRYTGTLTLIR